MHREVRSTRRDFLLHALINYLFERTIISVSSLCAEQHKSLPIVCKAAVMFPFSAKQTNACNLSPNTITRGEGFLSFSCYTKYNKILLDCSKIEQGNHPTNLLILEIVYKRRRTPFINNRYMQPRATHQHNTKHTTPQIHTTIHYNPQPKCHLNLPPRPTPPQPFSRRSSDDFRVSRRTRRQRWTTRWMTCGRRSRRTGCL